MLFPTLLARMCVFDWEAAFESWKENKQLEVKTNRNSMLAVMLQHAPTQEALQRTVALQESVHRKLDEEDFLAVLRRFAASDSAVTSSLALTRVYKLWKTTCEPLSTDALEKSLAIILSWDAKHPVLESLWLERSARGDLSESLLRQAVQAIAYNPQWGAVVFGELLRRDRLTPQVLEMYVAVFVRTTHYLTSGAYVGMLH